MAFQRSRQGKPPATEAELFEYAVKTLGSKMRSVRDLRRLMKLRAEPGSEGEAQMDRIIQRLEELKYLSDPRFAADFTRLRQENQSFGRRRVQQDLANKGIDKELVQTTLETAYEDVNEAALAKQYIERKRIKIPQDQKETARVLRRLIRAGFSTPTIFKVLRELKAPIEELDVEGLDEPES
ncbi:regulatory protein RecX [Terriglobus saanensis]|uniref:Regulatory protein RecX n=1 Tax=Terriglobus saanensis (strain ATCC BAA-1853 / DSM 23119 / SP1PR4) TaxID=401053 RepID=E8V2T9_TERSS|nr:regulatory protein RecX [Terriglobus saanensis]ADV84636.1 regulatory protein RecX [Terriglobus saanensis SP1PR4]